MYDQNLLAEYHIRYGSYGGIAYHHVADNYVALFSHFIPCGVWEAVYIIEGLLKNQSDIQPDTVHADTQGQSTPVFALSYLLGIKLMPRIRNWHDLVFFRPTGETSYQHIDALFKDVIDWNLIETHWKDLLRVVLSIKAGKSHHPRYCGNWVTTVAKIGSTKPSGNWGGSCERYSCCDIFLIWNCEIRLRRRPTKLNPTMAFQNGCFSVERG